MNFAQHPHYKAVRTLIKSNYQPTLTEMQLLFSDLGFKELPYSTKNPNNNDVRYYDPQGPHDVYYSLNARKGEIRKRNGRYGGICNPNPMTNRGRYSARTRLTAPFVNNIPKQMLYLASTMIANRLRNGGTMPNLGIRLPKLPQAVVAQPVARLTAQDFTNAMKQSAISDVFQLMPTAVAQGMFSGSVIKTPNAEIVSVSQKGDVISVQINIKISK